MTSFNLSAFILSLIIILSISFALKNISLFNQSQKKCFQITTRLQKKHRSLINKLLALNSLASQLRLEEKAARNAVKTAPDPYSKAAAVSWLSTVILRQSALGLSQRGLISSADQITNITRLKSLRKNNILIKANSLMNALYKSPSKSASPSYYLKNNFEKIKTITTVTNFSSFKRNIKNKFKYKKNKNLIGKYKCRATITMKNKEQTGDILIIGGKLSLRQLAF